MSAMKQTLGLLQARSKHAETNTGFREAVVQRDRVLVYQEGKVTGYMLARLDKPPMRSWRRTSCLPAEGRHEDPYGLAKKSPVFPGIRPLEHQQSAEVP